MPKSYTTSWWLFPPKTREVQFDEKWSFVGKKEKHCDPNNPDDAKQGDNWDHVALDPEHRLVVSVVPVRTPCPSARVVVDRFDLWRDGAHAIWLGEGDASNIRVESVNQGRGDRPWVLRPR